MLTPRLTGGIWRKLVLTFFQLSLNQWSISSEEVNGSFSQDSTVRYNCRKRYLRVHSQLVDEMGPAALLNTAT